VVILIGGIDLSAAALASLASIILASLIPMLGALGIVLTLLMTAAIGGLQGYVHAEAPVPAFVVTLAGLGIFSGVGLAMSRGSVTVREGYDLIKWLRGQFFGVPASFLMSAGALMVTALLLRFLPIGRHLYAVGLS